MTCFRHHCNDSAPVLRNYPNATAAAAAVACLPSGAADGWLAAGLVLLVLCFCSCDCTCCKTGGLLAALMLLLLA
jgi:hypothetical protein